MSVRYSETSKHYLINRFCNIMGIMGIPATSDPRLARIGDLYVEYNRTMGGYVIRKQETEGGAVSSPFGSGRFRAKEFAAFLTGVYETYHMLRNK